MAPPWLFCQVGESCKGERLLRASHPGGEGARPGRGVAPLLPSAWGLPAGRADVRRWSQPCGPGVGFCGPGSGRLLPLPQAWLSGSIIRGPLLNLLLGLRLNRGI